MAYQQGDTIQASDYNTFAGNVNTIIGTGSNDSGYGLSEIATINAGDTITAAQWNSLLSGLQKAANHQGTTFLERLALRWLIPIKKLSHS